MRLSDAPPPPNDDESAGSAGSADGADGGLDMSFLQRRIAEVEVAETERAAERQLTSMMQRASNWRTGNCAQRTLFVLEEWVRKLRVEDGLIACGTYSGEVVLADFDSGDLLIRWDPAGGEGGRQDAQAS